MTLQVGFVGTDGIVLASDLKWSEIQDGVRQTFLASKIALDEKRMVAISFARTMNASRRVVDAILADISDEEWKHPSEHKIQQVAGKATNFEASSSPKDANCLIVTPTLHLYRLDVDTYDGQQQLRCVRHYDKAYAGDVNNPALFWAEQYYAPRPVKSLVSLAARLVYSGSEISPHTIEGLEIVVCQKDGFRKLTRNSVANLLTVSRKASEDVQEWLLTDSALLEYEQSSETSSSC